MTINKLNKILKTLIHRGHGRKTVCVNKPTFYSSLEDDGHVLIDVSDAKLIDHIMIDDDGGQLILANGQESIKSSLILSGDG